MYAGELQKIAVVMRQFYGCEEMPGPARPDSMERLLRQAEKELQRDLPQAYIDFLRECDGYIIFRLTIRL